MRSRFASALLAFACLLLAACDVPFPIEAEYVGKWEGPNMVLSISSEGQIDYKQVSGITTTSLKVPIKKFEGGNIIAGLGPAETTFVISQAPTLEGNEWVMVVDGVRLVRQE